MKNGHLYEVRTPRSDVIFAIYDPVSMRVWTERSEYSARQWAAEQGYSIQDGGQITHADFLRLLGHEPARATLPDATPSPSATLPAAPVKPREPSSPPVTSKEITPDGSIGSQETGEWLTYSFEDEEPVDHVGLRLSDSQDAAKYRLLGNAFRSGPPVSDLPLPPPEDAADSNANEGNDHGQ